MTARNEPPDRWIQAYTLEDIETLEHEHPEFGRIEIVNGALYAGGADLGSDVHQGITFELMMLLGSLRPPGFVVRGETYWRAGPRQMLRPDVAIWAQHDRPVPEQAFQSPPMAVFEVLSRDRDHDLLTKHRIFREHGVATWYVDRRRTEGWWLGDGESVQVGDPSFELTLPGWPTVTITDAVLLG
ncbi:MAG TPA: Uma2 family endonuclease [Ilumatobacter sp.]|nr:Uma2 family endonuclease [Ilumatobacter sp.]